jgi:hypothetical protein
MDKTQANWQSLSSALPNFSGDIRHYYALELLKTFILTSDDPLNVSNLDIYVDRAVSTVDRFTEVLATGMNTPGQGISRSA